MPTEIINESNDFSMVAPTNSNALSLATFMRNHPPLELAVLAEVWIGIWILSMFWNEIEFSSTFCGMFDGKVRFRFVCGKLELSIKINLFINGKGEPARTLIAHNRSYVDGKISFRMQCGELHAFSSLISKCLWIERLMIDHVVNSIVWECDVWHRMESIVLNFLQRQLVMSKSACFFHRSEKWIGWWQCSI